MNEAAWGTIAAWAGVLLAIMGVIAKVLGRDLARIEASVTALDRAVKDEARLADDRIRASVLALDVRLQNEIRMLIEASHLRLEALEKRNSDLDGELRALTKGRP